MGFEGDNGDGLNTQRLDSLLDRLERLLAGMDDGDSASAVLSALNRLERRDVQSFSALEMFATALKSVSNHLSHLRNTTHTANLQQAAALEAIAQRLAGMEGKLDRPVAPQTSWPFDTETFADALATIADRLERVEAKVDRAAQQPALEPETTSSLLSAIAERVSRVEDKMDSGADGRSIAACLLAVDRRLSGIEERLGMDRPLPDQGLDAVTDTPQTLPPPPLPLIEGKPTDRVDQMLEHVFRVLSR